MLQLAIFHRIPVDTPLSESRFADVLEGWVDEKREVDEHDVHIAHDDHDDHDKPGDDHDDQDLEDDHDDNDGKRFTNLPNFWCFASPPLQS